VIQSSVSLFAKITDKRVLRVAPRCYLHRLLELITCCLESQSSSRNARKTADGAGEVDDESAHVERDVGELG
jgi:hypothetical protein